MLLMKQFVTTGEYMYSNAKWLAISEMAETKWNLMKNHAPEKVTPAKFISMLYSNDYFMKLDTTGKKEILECQMNPTEGVGWQYEDCIAVVWLKVNNKDAAASRLITCGWKVVDSLDNVQPIHHFHIILISDNGIELLEDNVTTEELSSKLEELNKVYGGKPVYPEVVSATQYPNPMDAVDKLSSIYHR